MPDSVTQILKSGPPGTKKNIAVLGDGFAAGDQDDYNDKVRELLTDGVFANDYFYEDAQAFNIYRVNLISNDSGVSQRVYDEQGTPTDRTDDTIVSTTIKDTALGYIYSGSWAHCWLESGANTANLVNDALDTWVPDYDLVVVILNEDRGGGCGGGNSQIVTKGSSWAVMAHEFGHGTGGLSDEYCKKGAYTGAEPGAVNVTTNTNRNTLKWRKFIKPTTPIPTGVNPDPTAIGSCTAWTVGAKPADWDSSQSVGLFEGGRTKASGVYRPVINCRMRGNAPPYCPVCYTELKTKMHPATGHSFLKTYVGDFNGDGKDDVLIHNGNSILIYRSDGSQLDIAFSAVERVPGSWQFKPGDRFYVGDFNGDGKDEVVVYNSTNWNQEYLGLLADDGNGGLKLIRRYDDSMPGWQFQKDDKFYVADFDGNGRDDLYVFNGANWSIPYVGMLRSNGTSFTLVKRYDGTMPGWQMRPGDSHSVGDFSGDGKEELLVFNGDDWSIPYLGMMRSNGSSLSMARRFDGTLPGWQMRPGDRQYVGDFNGDGKSDVYLFNGDDWSIAYLGMFISMDSWLHLAQRYDGNVPGWQMRKNDNHWVGDSGDGRSDLFVYNHQDWGPEYLGVMVSNGHGVTASWKEDWVGEWNLGTNDQFEVCDFEGVGVRRNLFVHNQNWFGIIRATPNLSLLKIYYKWIHNYRYGRNW
ncbi:MAG: hypothetical protein BMS9Abin17_0426 [Acidimicrobiia bacterium]|nr:MAG: hypothetical protein BMS9Abin17_0426 [Acidimicrobiia bacterium]